MAKLICYSGILVSLLFFAGVNSLSADFVDFEDVVSSGNPRLTSVDAGGFRFTSSHSHTIDSPVSAGGIPQQPSSSIYMGHEGSRFGSAVTMVSIGGSSFSIFGIDAAGLWLPDNAAFPNGTHVELFATFAAGGDTTSLLPLLEPAEWKTYAVSLQDLSSLHINGVIPGTGGDFAFAVDNIQLIPEPTSLLLIRLTTVFVCRRR